MPARQPRVPWAPLWDFAADRGCTGIGDLARQCGQDVRDLHRWRRDGGIPERAADRVAVALGVVPDLIWGEAWAEATAALVERAEVEEAEALAEAEAKLARFRAQRAAAMRRLRMRNPAYAERQRVAARQYKAECKEYVLAYNKQYNRQLRARLRQMESGEGLADVG